MCDSPAADEYEIEIVTERRTNIQEGEEPPSIETDHHLSLLPC